MVSLFQLRSFGTQSPTTTPSTIEMTDSYILPPIFPKRNPDNRPRQVVEDGPTPSTSVTTETDENTSTTEEMGTSTVVPITTEDDENIPTTEGSTTKQISTSHDEDSSTTEGLTTVEMSTYTLLNILTTRIIDQGVDEVTKNRNRMGLW